jgi:hypothetical protein
VVGIRVLAEKHRPEVGMRQTRPSPETQNPPPCETQTPQKLKKTAEEPHKLTKGQLKRHVFSPQDQGRGGLRVEAVAEGVACEVDQSARSYMKCELNQNLSVNEVYYTASSSLVISNNSCWKLHCLKGFNLIPFSYKIRVGVAWG